MNNVENKSDLEKLKAIVGPENSRKLWRHIRADKSQPII
jgi:hypothetical protein